MAQDPFQKKRPNLSSRARPGRPGSFDPSDTVFPYVPQARQRVFHACDAEVILYGGAAGGGKSMAILAEDYTRAREIAGSYNIVFRRTFPELEKSLILKSRQLFPKAYCKYNEMTHRWTVRPADLGPDSIVDFGYCRNAKEAEEMYKSAEFITLSIDEVTLMDWETVRFLMSRARSSIPGVRPRIIFGANPGGIGHMWAKEYFGIWKPDEEGYVPPETVFTPKPTEEDPEPMSRCFIPAKLSDNPALEQNDPSYRKKLMLLPVHKRKMLLDGDWEVFEGRFFPEFVKSVNVVAPFDVPKHWKCYRGIDYGFSAPFCCLWFAVAPDGHIFVYREVYMRNLRDKEQATLVRDMTLEPIEYSMADPSMFSKNASGVSVAENYLLSGGIGLFPSKNDRPMGWMACRNMLAKHSDGTPILKIFSSCTNLIKEIEAAVFGDSEKTPDDINIHSRRDHALDAWRYFAISRPIIPMEPTDDPYRHLDEASRREWQRYDENVRKQQHGDTRATLHGINREDGDGDEQDLNF